MTHSIDDLFLQKKIQRKTTKYTAKHSLSLKHILRKIFFTSHHEEVH